MNALDAAVDRLDIHVGFFSASAFIESRVIEDLGKEGVVDLDLKPGVDNGQVFMAQRRPNRMKELFVGCVELVAADSARRHRWDERGMVFVAGECSRQIVEIGGERIVSLVNDGSDASCRVDRRHRSTQHRALKVVLVILGKRRDFGGKCLIGFVRPRLESIKPFINVGKETGFRHFAVSNDIDAGLNLPGDDASDRIAYLPLIGSGVVGCARQSGCIKSRSVDGRGRLPTCVVRIRSALGIRGLVRRPPTRRTTAVLCASRSGGRGRLSVAP